MPTQPEAFLEPLNMSGPRPCARSLQKRPCATLVRLVGRTTNTDFFPTLDWDTPRPAVLVGTTNTDSPPPGRTLLPAVLTLLVLFFNTLLPSSFSSSVSNRLQQLGNEGFARTTGIKNGTLLKHRQTSFRKRTNAKSQPVKKLVVHK